MTYNFDEVIDRRPTDSVKWKVAENELPMWVADMDFKTAPEIVKAVENRLSHGIFGYSIIPDFWYTAYMDWWRNRHNFAIEKDWLLFSTGVVPAISSMIRHLTKPDEKVLIQPPVYNAFFHVIEDNDRETAENPLIYEKVEYSVDFEDLDKKLSDPKVTLMILCSPHNPIGKIWDKNTLKKIGELCQKHGTLIISDEIHCDLTDPGRDYIPFASVCKDCKSITCIAPTKTFNLAGMKTAALVIPDEALRQKVKKAIYTDSLNDANGFSCIAAHAAYTEGEPWLNQLRQYLYENKQIVYDFISKEIPQVTTTNCEATYLMWLDCGKVKGFTKDSPQFIREKTGLFLSEGKIYGKQGEKCMRLNVACPKSTLQDGLNRLKKGIELVEENS